MERVRVLTHIKKLDDAFGQFLVRVSCPCGASRHIKPEALARLVGWSAMQASLAPRLRCSQCGRKHAEVVAVAWTWSKWAYAHDPRAKAPKRKKREIAATERERRRRATINKTVTYLKAALDRAFEHGHVEARAAWARLRKFKGTDNARITRLSTEEARRLTNAAAPDFRRLLELALLTGARYGELIAFRTRDFDEGSGTLLVAESKSGKPRRIPLTDEGRQLLESLTAGKTPDEVILMKADGTAWKKNDQFERIRETCSAAKISPPINFHAIRHTTASLLVEKGVPLAFVAELLGHADTRMVSKHYAHLARSVVHEEIRAKLPSFSVGVDGKVTKLRR